MDEKPSIIAFSGHMTDAPHRPVPRFPESHVPEVRAKLRAALARQRQPIRGVSSAARGGDLIFIEEVLALAGSVTVILPFPPQDFKQTSVGQGWDAVFDRLLGLHGVEVEAPLHALLPRTADEQNAAFAACNEHIVAQARALAAQYQVSDALFLAVYKQTGSDLAGGTMHAFQTWTSAGGRLELIEP